jgi:uncharacterized protein (TIGR00369 family)
MSRFAVLPPDIHLKQPGLETLRAMIAGELPGPPIAETLNFTLAEAEAGRVVFTGDPQENALNPQGTVHGGWTATILDSALACAVHSTLDLGERYTSVEMKVSFLRPIILGRTGPLRCEAQVIHRGRTLALSEARLVCAAGKVYAHGTETCMIFPKEGPGA